MIECSSVTSGITGSVAMWTPSTLKSQRTLNGLACLVNSMYITYAIQHGYFKLLT